jgi:peptidoglycan/xylan/chitin deacetylase (PgdA/CDA1 family)
MKYLSITLIAALLFLPAGCSSSKGVKANRPPMSQCQDELNAIPEVAAWTKARNKPAEQVDGRPLEGMEIALTINRMLPAKVDPETQESNWCDHENTRENFDKLVAALKQNEMPPTVDFIIGHALLPETQQGWLESGNLLGNMTFSRKKPKKGTAEEFIQSIELNEQALAPILANHPKGKKYFRFPGLTLTSEPQKLAQINSYLKQKGYVVVPATIDSRDEVFSQNYCAALARADQSCTNLIKTTFKSVLLDRTLRAREAARRIAGHDVKHILMIEANQLTCDTLGELLAWYKALGARFISIDEALGDQFYAGDNVTAKAKEIIYEAERALLVGEGK